MEPDDHPALHPCDDVLRACARKPTDENRVDLIECLAAHYEHDYTMRDYYDGHVARLRNDWQVALDTPRSVTFSYKYYGYELVMKVKSARSRNRILMTKT